MFINKRRILLLVLKYVLDNILPNLGMLSLIAKYLISHRPEEAVAISINLYNPEAALAEYLLKLIKVAIEDVRQNLVLE